jgi:hypothetical protein
MAGYPSYFIPTTLYLKPPSNIYLFNLFISSVADVSVSTDIFVVTIKKVVCEDTNNGRFPLLPHTYNIIPTTSFKYLFVQSVYFFQKA